MSVAINGADPIDIAVGSAIRRRRLALKISQQDLARTIGLTFQQVQKYERGLNRVSASKLFAVAAALDCRPGDLFPEPVAQDDAPRTYLDAAKTLEARRPGLIDKMSRLPKDVLAAHDINVSYVLAAASPEAVVVRVAGLGAVVDGEAA